MKIKILSDLHLEFQPFVYEYHNEDVVVLAGDITPHVDQLIDLINEIPITIPIVFVAGNHEFYHTDYHDRKEKFRLLMLERPKRFYFLDNDCVVIDNVPFFGGMMCTDFSFMSSNTALTKVQAQQGLNDFRYIRNGDRLWSVEDHVEEFEQYAAALKKFVHEYHGRYDDLVVISHFMPSPECVEVRFVNSPLNPYFTSDMTTNMGWRGLWIAGHGHNSIDQQYGDTRLIMNPRGYCNQHRCENDQFKPDLVVEI